MLDILIVFTCLSQYLAPTTLRQLRRVTEAMLSMTGRVTMKGLSRWTDKVAVTGRSNRFFNTSISWCKLQWVLIRHHLLEPDDVIVMGGDESGRDEIGQADAWPRSLFFPRCMAKPSRGCVF